MSLQSRENEDFIQAVQCLLHRTPTVVLFNQQQLADIRSFCCRDAPAHLRSVFAVGRTFNLSSLHVTVTVFRHRKVVRKSTQEAPIFIGPMMLHGDGKYDTYRHFFSMLAGALNGDVGAAELRLFDSMISGAVFDWQNWQEFLRVDSNKTELFYFLAQTDLAAFSTHGKTVVFTCNESVRVAAGYVDISGIERCNHEEADTRIILHSYHAACSGCDKVCIRTVDTSG